MRRLTDAGRTSYHYFCCADYSDRPYQAEELLAIPVLPSFHQLPQLTPVEGEVRRLFVPSNCIACSLLNPNRTGPTQSCVELMSSRMIMSIGDNARGRARGMTTESGLRTEVGDELDVRGTALDLLGCNTHRRRKVWVDSARYPACGDEEETTEHSCPAALHIVRARNLGPCSASQEARQTDDDGNTVRMPGDGGGVKPNILERRTSSSIQTQAFSTFSSTTTTHAPHLFPLQRDSTR